jgi:hypothetical protein
MLLKQVRAESRSRDASLALVACGSHGARLDVGVLGAELCVVRDAILLTFGVMFFVLY